jgi:peptide deformylase|tara:strand:+ start:141 stop:842 length:702 start_codon:yes stop_codon:yes gene_type:complete
MAEKLTPEKIEEAARHYENITSGKTPILKSEKETKIIDAHLDVSKFLEKKEQKTVLPLINPKDPRLLMQVAEFKDDMLEHFKLKDRKELGTIMYDTMKKYGGIGLSANQVGLPYRMFVMGGHPSIEQGKTRYVFNPLVNDVSKETINLKEGCLSFPFLFLMINRPKWCSVKYTDENGKEVEETLHGMSARIFMHENEHMNGYVFTELVSKMKLDRAKKAQKKLIKETVRRQNR